MSGRRVRLIDAPSAEHESANAMLKPVRNPAALVRDSGRTIADFCCRPFALDSRSSHFNAESLRRASTSHPGRNHAPTQNEARGGPLCGASLRGPASCSIRNCAPCATNLYTCSSPELSSSARPPLVRLIAWSRRAKNRRSREYAGWMVVFASSSSAQTRWRLFRGRPSARVNPAGAKIR